MAAARISRRSTVALSFRRGQCWQLVRWPLLCPFPRSTQPMRASGSRSDGGVREAGRGEAIARAAETPHILLNAPLTGQRLGYPDLSRARPARTVRLRPSGAVRGADGGGDVPRAGDRSRRTARLRRRRVLGAIAEALLATLGDADWPEREGAWTSNVTLHRLGWGWAGFVGRAAGAARARRADAVFAAAAMGGSGRAARRRARCRSARRGAGAAGRADRRGGRAARGAEGDGGGGGGDLRAAPGGGRAQHAARRGGDRDRQDAGLSGAGVAVGGARRRGGVGVDLHQGAAAAIGCRRRAAGRRPGRAQAADRGPQGPRELSVPAQSGGCDAGRVCGAGGDTGATGRALGGLFEGRRHGRRRLAGLAAEPVPPRGRDGADRPARRVRLCRLPALPQMLHRARRAGRARGRYRHRQPCAGDGQRRARAARRADADPVRRGPSSVRRRRFDLRGRADRAGSDRDAALDRRARGQGARAAARACGAADGCLLL